MFVVIITQWTSFPRVPHRHEANFRSRGEGVGYPPTPSFTTTVTTVKIRTTPHNHWTILQHYYSSDARGSTARRCTVPSYTTTLFRWFYRQNAHETPIEEVDHFLVRDGTLVIPSVKESDAGTYFCNASNKEGSEVLEMQLSVSASLQSRGVVVSEPGYELKDLEFYSQLVTWVFSPKGEPPQWSPGSPNRDSNLCLPVLSSRAQHDKRTSVFWLKDSQPLRTGARVRLVAKEHVHLVEVSKEDRGMYQCVVKNDVEMAQGTAELALGEVYPQLVYKFIDQTMQPGPSVSLKCSASGNPTPQINWLLDGFPLTHNDRLMIGQYVTVFGDVISHVNISSVKTEDGGEYECVAENKAGKARHADRLNIYGPPHVRHMSPIPAVAGKHLIIKCPVAGYPIESIVWEKDGVRLPTNIRQRVNMSVLMVENVQLGSDQGNYACTARNKQNISSHRSVEVRVLVPPKITPFIFARDLNVGDRTSIQCVVVNGDLPLHFSWVKDNKGSLTSTTSTTSTVTSTEHITLRQYDDFTSALSISRITRAHSGDYTCRVSNDAATVTHTAQLRVNVGVPRPHQVQRGLAGNEPFAALLSGTNTCPVLVPPRISPFYFEKGVTEGMRTQLMCTASQGDRPFNITWRKDARSLGPAADEWINVSDYAPFSSILTINSVTSSHSGNFTCVVDNQAGTAEYTAHLSVTGREPGEYRELDYHGQRIQAMANGSLIIPHVSEEHEGYFLCQASNGIGPGLSKVIKLTVYAGPRFKVRSRQETARKGELVHLRCEAEGDPPMEITWKAKGSRVDPGFDISYASARVRVSLVLASGVAHPNHKYHQSTLKTKYKVRQRMRNDLRWYLVKVTPLPHGVLSELSIVEASHLDRGEYTCIASNAFGQDYTNIQLLVQEPPIFPRNLQVAEQTSRSIQLTWSPSLGDSPVTSYILQYKENRDVWHEHNPQKVVSGDRTFLIVQGLKPATLYHFRLYAENQLGTSAPSDVLHGITESEVPSGPPLQVNVEPMSSTQLRITWHPPERELWNGDLLGYNIGYRKLGTDKDTYNWTRVAVAGETMGDFRLTGLDKFAQYSIILEAFNTKGDGPPSDQIIAQTLEDVPSAAPMALSCSALTSQNLQVMWHPPPTHLTHGNIQAYKLYYEPTEEWYETDVRETKVTTALTSVLHGLLPFTNYSLQILATTKAGDGVLSPVTYCMTEEAVPEAPERVKAVVVSEDTVVVSWLPPRRPNGLLTKYTVYIRVMEQGQEMKVIKGTLPAQHTHYDAVGLSTKETYEAWVTASNKVGEGPSTMVVTLKPRSVVPAAIVSFGQMLVVAWKVNVKMICLCVGIPRPIAEWKLGDQKLHSQPRVRKRSARLFRQRQSRWEVEWSLGNVSHGGKSDGVPATMEVTAENTLFIQNVQRNNEGNYSCHVKNNLGSDSIMYSLQVQVPPTAPLLLATTITLNSVQLQWKQGDNGGAAVKGFLLAYRREFGEWEEISVERRATTYLLEGLRCGTRYQFRMAGKTRLNNYLLEGLHFGTRYQFRMAGLRCGTRYQFRMAGKTRLNNYLLDGLRCGTRYQFRMAAFNKIGSGSASSLEVARTKGGKPIAPPSARFLKINSTSVHLILSAWQDADCPILYFVVESRRDGPTNENEWRLVSNNILPQQRFPLVDLTPGTRYFLRVAGHNHAGSTLAEYDFTTLSPNTEHRNNVRVTGVSVNRVEIEPETVDKLSYSFCAKERRTPEFYEEMLYRVRQEPSIISRAVSRALGVSPSTILQVLHEDGMEPYHARKVRVISERVYDPRVNS
uniref:Down syndrome cell adhesion molecule-like protein Dscam2 n=1 Tax=Timema cristinae TaxID=61476 RepID=A0A7R9CEP7_TIMCR|nr:unnamed protein product [Timema cristinae]